MDILKKLSEIKRMAGKAKSRLALARFNKEKRRAKLDGFKYYGANKGTKKVPKRKPKVHSGNTDSQQQAVE